MGFLFVILGTLMWSLDTLIRYPLLATLRPDTMVFVVTCGKGSTFMLSLRRMSFVFIAHNL